MTPPLLVTELPERLVKFYRRPEFAEALCTRGEIRMHSIQFYTETGDTARADTNEGTGHLQVPGEVPVVRISIPDGRITSQTKVDGHFNVSTTWTNPTYLYCTSMLRADITSLRSRFGQYVVEIAEPQSFVEALHAAIVHSDLGGREVHFVDCFPVRYGRGAVAPLPADLNERIRLSFGQKAPTLSIEREYRIAAALSGGSQGAPPRLDLRLEGTSPYCRLAD